MSAPIDPSRRRFLGSSAAVSLALLVAPELLRAQDTDDDAISTEVIARAERLAGLEFTPEERELMRNSVTEHLRNLEAIRGLAIGNDVPPALGFRPLGLERAWRGGAPAEETGPAAAQKALARGSWAQIPDEPPSDEEDLAFAPVLHLSHWIRRGKITAVELTEFFLRRLESLDPKLEFVISLTADRALQQAASLDAELERGQWRGPLHGIPWGAKDIIAVRGTPTTWGARPYRDQRFDFDAEVVRRLDAAGAVLVAKTSVGALAWGDVWFDGTTKNPWNPQQGSSGSSAGSASAVAAGALPFALGTETLGSIVSPCSRCGATGIRPTFGRVPRTGCMALSWSMDKIGPIARNVADAALVLGAIEGADTRDRDSVSAPLRWESPDRMGLLHFGYAEQAFESDYDEQAIDRTALDVIRALGVKLRPVELPTLPVGDMLVVLEVEAAAAFDELTRTNRDDELVRQVENAWPNVMRAAQLVPAVQYVQAQRARTLLMEAMERSLGDLDGYVAPSFAGPSLLITNLTGHPTIVVPNGFRDDGTPTSLSFVGRNYGEGAIAALAAAFQQATDFHLRRPRL